MNTKVRTAEQEFDVEEWVDDIERKVISQSHQVTDLDRFKMLCARKGREYRIAGHGPMVTSPTYTKRFVYRPSWLDNSIIPEEGLEILEDVCTECDVRGIILGHELKIENEELKNLWEDERVRNAAKWVAICAAVGTALAIGGLVIAPAIAGASTAGATAAASTASAASVATTAAGTGVSTGTLTAVGAGVALLALDPILICCLPDPEQTWVQIFEWFD